MAGKSISLFEIEVSKNFSSGISTHVDWEPRTNIIETENSLVIEVELSGVEKDDISIIMQSNRELVIRGNKRQPRLNDPQVTYYLFEREFGSFYKKIVINFPLETSNIKSVMENGVLTITIAKKKIKKVSVDIK